MHMRTGSVHPTIHRQNRIRTGENSLKNRFVPDRKTLLTGDVRMLVLRIAAPSLAAMLATGVGTLLDALYMANESPEAASAMGVCFPLLTAQQAIGFTLGMGAGSHVSRSLGAGDGESAQKAASSALLFALMLGGALLAAGLWQLRPLLRLLGASDAVTPYAIPYARFLLLCAPVSCAALVLSSLLRAQGKTPANMRAALISSGTGALLGWILIRRMRLGVWGAGISLLVRECTSLALLTLSTLRTKDILRPSLRRATLAPWVYPAILRSGLPTLLRQGLMSVSAAMTSRAAASFGPAALAGMGIAARAGALISSAAIGFGQGFQPICGFNYGAGKLCRVRAAYAFCLRCIVFALALLGVLCFFFGDALLRVFRADAGITRVALSALRAQSVVFFAQGAVIMMNMLTQSMGKTIRATLVATSRQGIFLIPLLLILPRCWGISGLILCQSIADVAALAFSWLLTRSAAVDKDKCAH